MRLPDRAGSGYSLIELIVALLLLGLLSSFALPSFKRSLDRWRVRAALNQVTGEIYRARLHAIESGRSSLLILHPGTEGCVSRARTALEGGGAIGGGVGSSSGVVMDLPGLCLRHSGDSILVFNSRGILRPPARSVWVSYGGAADSILVSIAGRVRRSYRRRRRG